MFATLLWRRTWGILVLLAVGIFMLPVLWQILGNSWATTINRMGLFLQVIASSLTLIGLAGKERVESWENGMRDLCASLSSPHPFPNFADPWNLAFLSSQRPLPEFTDSRLGQHSKVYIRAVIGIAMPFTAMYYAFTTAMSLMAWADNQTSLDTKIFFGLGFIIWPILYWALIMWRIRRARSAFGTRELLTSIGVALLFGASIFTWPPTEILVGIMAVITKWIGRQLPLTILVGRITLPAFLLGTIMQLLSTYFA